jgi:hypothetical protein
MSPTVLSGNGQLAQGACVAGLSSGQPRIRFAARNAAARTRDHPDDGKFHFP